MTQAPEDDQQGVGEGEDHQHEQGHGHSRPQQFGQHQVDGQNSEQEAGGEKSTDLDGGTQTPGLKEVGDMVQARRGVSCENSMHEWMPRPISWASPGGKAPKEQSCRPTITPLFMYKESPRAEAGEEIGCRDQGGDQQDGDQQGGDLQGGDKQGGHDDNKTMFMKMKQPTLRWPVQGDVDREEIKGEGNTKEEKPEDRKGFWVQGGNDEDNERYRAFLQYCEDRREEQRKSQEEDEERKRTAQKRMKH